MHFSIGFFFLSAFVISQGVNALSIEDQLSKGGSGGGSGSGGGGTANGRGGTGGGAGTGGGGGAGTGGGNGGGQGGLSAGGARGAGTGRGGSGDTGHSAIQTTIGSNFGGGGRLANFFSRGGGVPFILGAGAVFVGRKMGGGLREQIVGSSRYGSGYPYTEGDVIKTGVSGQPFPFGFWPIYWAYHGYGGEYAGGEGGTWHNTTVTDQRPGGPLVYVEVTVVNGSKWDYSRIYPSQNDTYYMIGDKGSVEAMMSLLIDTPHDGTTEGKPFGCGAQNKTTMPFITTNPDGSPLVYPNSTVTNTTTSSNATTATPNATNTTTLPIRFENVLIWYRASSFAIAYENYTNTYALAPLNETTGVGWENSSLFPGPQQISPFLHCVNRTIAAALPILDAEQEESLTAGQIAGIVIGGICGAVILGVGAWFGWKFWRNKKVQRQHQQKEYHSVASKEQSVQDEKDSEAKQLPS
ncbi:hypothetical protein FRC14_006937 [Serendipita sp. 396]|nr:hypothetical protein FRC14_006937 [Serendipita sp. 396]KAG8778355.1 hypothetical protein FRC15_010842 [Serendipita sp. 397]KAG8863650.1 hypothetical protein FRC20_010637 [Serendipita sp. 405]